jgi:hypothetical protein
MTNNDWLAAAQNLSDTHGISLRDAIEILKLGQIHDIKQSLVGVEEGLRRVVYILEQKNKGK